MKRTLIQAVEEVLFANRSLDRGIYREATLRRLVEEAKRGVADHAYLLQVLLIIDLWQDENL